VPRLSKLLLQRMRYRARAKIPLLELPQSVIARVEPAGRNAERFMLVIKMIIGMAIAWFFFYVIGQLLMLIPPDIHDGSYLRNLGQ
jgi:hypothetical protein